MVFVWPVRLVDAGGLSLQIVPAGSVWPHGRFAQEKIPSTMRVIMISDRSTMRVIMISDRCTMGIIMISYRSTMGVIVIVSKAPDADETLTINTSSRRTVVEENRRAASQSPPARCYPTLGNPQARGLPPGVQIECTSP
jgi:hypothetical protein